MAFPAITRDEPNDFVSPPSRATKWAPVAFWNLILAAAYIATGKLGLSHPSVADSVTLIWPPTGIAVFALTCWGRRYWPGVFLGAFAVNVAISPAWAAAGIALGNTVGPWAAAWLLTRLQFDRSFLGTCGVFRYAAWAAGAAMLIPAVNGTGWLIASGAIGPDRMIETATTWWMGDACGVLLVGPPLFLLPMQFAIWRKSRLFAVGQVLGLTVTVAVSFAVFWDVSSLGRPRLPLAFFPFVAAFLVILTFRVWAGSVAMLLVSVVAAAGTAAGAGPFAEFDGPTKLLLLWTFATTGAVVLLIAAATQGHWDRAALALATREEEYRTVLAETPALLIRFKPDGRITFSNDWARRFFGRSLVETTGPPISSFIPEADRARAAAILDDHAKTGALTPFEIEHDTPDGKRVVCWVARAVRDELGDVFEFHGIGVDVTEQRRTESDRRRLDEQMVEMQKLESLGVLAAGIAHDFNNVLTAVAGFADLAEASLHARHPAAKHMARVRESSARAADLARQLLAYAGHGKIVIGPVGVNGLVRDSIRLLETGLPKRAALATDFADGEISVHADAAQLRQVLMNLVMNAGEALGESAGIVTVRTSRMTVTGGEFGESTADRALPKGEYVELTVDDTGCGMDDETRAKIFDPFFTTKFTGRGLGLAAVLGIVRGHRGTIRVRSRVGVGTTVTVVLPVSVPTPTTETKNDIDLRKETVVDSSETQRSARPFALVVDDEEAVRYITGAMLERLGWSVLAAASGREAVELFRREGERIGVVILDMTMPEMDGHETLAELRLLRPDVPVIICSGYARDAIEGGTDAPPYLPKPFLFDDLKVAVDAVA